MEILIVIGSLFVCFALGVPIAYALGLAALAGAYWIGIPLEAVMLQVSSGVSKFAMLTIPFFVLAGAIMAEGGMARRLVAFANVLVGMVRASRRVVCGQRPGDDLPQRHFGVCGGRHLGDRLGDDPADGEDRLSAGLRDQCDDQRLGPGAARAAEPQCSDLFAGHRRHDLDHQPVYGRGYAGPAARRLADRAVSRPRLSQRASPR